MRLSQADLMAKIEAPSKMEEHTQANEELRKTNEELRRNLHRHGRRPIRKRSPGLSSRDDPKPFSQQIMEEFVPPHYITPKIDFFSSVGDPESHLKAFRNQMIFFGGLDAIQCEMLMGTFTGITLQWFNGILDGHITSFPQFSRMFKEQFSTNKVNPPRLYDLFNVKQREGESLKEYLNKICAVSVRLQTQDEEMEVSAFVEGMTKNPFSDSLIYSAMKTLSEVCE